MFRPVSEFFEMTQIHERCEVQLLAFFFTSCIFTNLLFTFVCTALCKLRSHCNDFHRMWERNKFVNKVEVRHRNMTWIRNAGVVLPALAFFCAKSLCFSGWCLVIVGRTRCTVRTRIITQLVYKNEMVCSWLMERF